MFLFEKHLKILFKSSLGVLYGIKNDLSTLNKTKKETNQTKQKIKLRIMKVRTNINSCNHILIIYTS